MDTKGRRECVKDWEIGINSINIYTQLIYNSVDIYTINTVYKIDN